MLRNIASGIALFATFWGMPVAAQTSRQDAPVVRTLTGVRCEVPGGMGVDGVRGLSAAIGLLRQHEKWR